MTQIVAPPSAVRTATLLLFVLAGVHVAPAAAQPFERAALLQAAPPAEPAAPEQPQGPEQPEEPAQPQSPEQPQEPQRPRGGFDDFGRVPPFPVSRGNPALRIGGDYTLAAGEEVEDVVVIAGDARIDGHVDRDVVVILGSARIGSAAVIEGSLVVIGGRVTVDPGARVDDDFVVVGGTVDAPPDFTPGSEHIVVEPEVLGVSFEPLVPWVTQGLLWGRIIVPGLAWTWTIVPLFFLIYLALNAFLDRPVQACARTLAERPLTSLGVGLLSLFLAGPIFLLLAVSVVGVVVIPFAACAMVVAWILGKVGVARAIGLAMIADAPERTGTPPRGRATAAFILGFAVLVVAYMVPLVGLIAWTMVGVIGFGAASLAFISGYRRENPATNGRTRAAQPGAWPSVPPVPPPAPRVMAAAAAAEPSPSAAVPPPAMAADMPAAPIQSAAAEPASATAHEAPAEPLPPPAPPPQPAPSPANLTLLSFRRAYFRERLAAFVVDVLLVAVTLGLLDFFGRSGPRTVLLLLLVYYISFWTWKGTTVGGIICQLRVVRMTGAPLQFSDALVRGLTGILSLVPLGIGAFWILMDPERQAWHDKVAGTYVVKVPHGWPV